jgi:hypothetical protein
MIALMWNVSVAIRRYLGMYMPTSIAIDLLRTRRGLKWAVPAALVAVPAYLFAAAMASSAITAGRGGSTSWSCSAAGTQRSSPHWQPSAHSAGWPCWAAACRHDQSAFDLRKRRGARGPLTLAVARCRPPTGDYAAITPVLLDLRPPTRW